MRAALGKDADGLARSERARLGGRSPFVCSAAGGGGAAYAPSARAPSLPFATPRVSAARLARRPASRPSFSCCLASSVSPRSSRWRSSSICRIFFSRARALSGAAAAGSCDGCVTGPGGPHPAACDGGRAATAGAACNSRSAAASCASRVGSRESFSSWPAFSCSRGVFFNSSTCRNFFSIARLYAAGDASGIAALRPRRAPTNSCSRQARLTLAKKTDPPRCACSSHGSSAVRAAHVLRCRAEGGQTLLED